MKKGIFILLSLLLALSSKAQKLSIGTRIGGSISSISGKGLESEYLGNFSYTNRYGTTYKGNKKFIIRPIASLYARYLISESLFLQSEIGIATTGYNQIVDIDDTSHSNHSTEKSRITSIQIPLLLGYSMEHIATKPFFLIGITPSIGLAYKYAYVSTTTYKGSQEVETEKEGDSGTDFGSLEDRLDWGLTLGAGIRSIPSKPNIGIDIRYIRGRNIWEDNEYALRNNAFNITLLYRFK